MVLKPGSAAARCQFFLFCEERKGAGSYSGAFKLFVYSRMSGIGCVQKIVIIVSLLKKKTIGLIGVKI